MYRKLPLNNLGFMVQRHDPSYLLYFLMVVGHLCFWAGHFKDQY